MLVETPQVSELHPVPDADVPFMRFKFNGGCHWSSLFKFLSLGYSWSKFCCYIVFISGFNIYIYIYFLVFYLAFLLLVSVLGPASFTGPKITKCWWTNCLLFKWLQRYWWKFKLGFKSTGPCYQFSFWMSYNNRSLISVLLVRDIRFRSNGCLLEA